jgi:hypothetical protein
MIEAIKHIQDEEGFSVLVKDLDINMDFWVDVWNDGGLRYDWNQYIFGLLNSDDVSRRDYQNDPDNFDECTSAAVSYLEKLELI